MEQTPKLAITTFILAALALMNLGLKSPAYSQIPESKSESTEMLCEELAILNSLTNRGV